MYFATRWEFKPIVFASWQRFCQFTHDRTKEPLYSIVPLHYNTNGYWEWSGYEQWTISITIKVSMYRIVLCMVYFFPLISFDQAFHVPHPMDFFFSLNTWNLNSNFRFDHRRRKYFNLMWKFIVSPYLWISSGWSLCRCGNCERNQVNFSQWNICMCKLVIQSVIHFRWRTYRELSLQLWMFIYANAMILFHGFAWRFDVRVGTTMAIAPPCGHSINDHICLYAFQKNTTFKFLTETWIWLIQQLFCLIVCQCHITMIVWLKDLFLPFNSPYHNTPYVGQCSFRATIMLAVVVASVAPTGATANRCNLWVLCISEKRVRVYVYIEMYTHNVHNVYIYIGNICIYILYVFV